MQLCWSLTIEFDFSILYVFSCIALHYNVVQWLNMQLGWSSRTQSLSVTRLTWVMTDAISNDKINFLFETNIWHLMCMLHWSLALSSSCGRTFYLRGFLLPVTSHDMAFSCVLTGWDSWDVLTLATTLLTQQSSPIQPNPTHTIPTLLKSKNHHQPAHWAQTNPTH